MDRTVCGLPLPGESDLAQPISAVVMVKGLDEDGKVAYWTSATEDLMLTEAIGMAIAMADEFRDERRLAAFPVRFTAVSAVHGKDRTDFPLAGDPPLEQLAAEAYLAGWILSGGPITERATPGCAAAIAAALEHQHDPRVLEVTLQIGHLEGAWALVFARREQLIADHTAKIQALWRKAAAKLDAASMVHSFRQHAGLTREARDSGWAAILRVEAIAAAAGMLNGIRSGAEFEELVTAIEVALAAGLAEGQTAAMAIAAEVAGYDGFGWDAAYAHMYEPLTHLEDLPGMADEWVQRLIDGNAADIGRSLASLASDGGTYDEMLASVRSLTTGDSIRAVQMLIDYAMSGSAGRGALSLYASEGVTQVAWLTAGDERVCLTCESNEAQGPYSPDQFPQLPAHPLCRCSPAPASGPGLSLQAYAQFLPAA